MTIMYPMYLIHPPHPFFANQFKSKLQAMTYNEVTFNFFMVFFLRGGSMEDQ